MVASMFLPFGYEFGVGRMYLYVDPPPPEPSPEYANRIYYWSFMHIQEVFEKTADGWVLVGSQRLFFFDYWTWWGPGTSGVRPLSVLIPMFFVQVALLFIGPLTLLKAKKELHTLLLFFSLLVLDYLYSFASHVQYSELSAGFWLSGLSTILILIPLVYTSKPMILNYGRRIISFHFPMPALIRALISLWSAVWGLFWLRVWYIRRINGESLNFALFFRRAFGSQEAFLRSISDPYIYLSILLFASCIGFLMRKRGADAFTSSVLFVGVCLDAYLLASFYSGSFTVAHLTVSLEAIVNSLIVLYFAYLVFANWFYRKLESQATT